MRATRTATMLVFGLSLLGCDDATPENGPSTPMSVTPPTAAPTSSIRPPGDAYPDADVPVPADFEPEVATEITKANHLEELRALEEAIGGASPAPSASASAR